MIVGSGIRSAGQFTTEAISHIKNADKVLYCVSDPVTETYIRDLFPGAMDLGVFFDGSKDRYDSCVQMAEACLFFPRQGLYTVAIFPGHPGMFSIPALRAIQIAKKQGTLTQLFTYCVAYMQLIKSAAEKYMHALTEYTFIGHCMSSKIKLNIRQLISWQELQKASLYLIATTSYKAQNLKNIKARLYLSFPCPEKLEKSVTCMHAWVIICMNIINFSQCRHRG